MEELVMYDPCSGGMLTQSRVKCSYTVFVVMLFFVLSLFNIMNHEMWRDELQAWLIAQHSDSITNLFENLRYEGTPALWHLFLYGFGKLVAHPIIMQVFHIVVATCTIFVVVVFSPFTSMQKILFTFGYFPFYEYAVISRSYALGILGIVVFCALYPTRKKRYIAIGTCLSLLCQTSVYGLMFALLFCGLLILDFCVENNSKKDFRQHKRDISFSLAILFLGICISIVQLIPPDDCGTNKGWYLSFDLFKAGQVLATIWNSYVPIPKIGIQFWNSNILGNYGLVRVVLSAILFIVNCVFLSRTPLIMAVFGVGTAGMLMFQYLKVPGNLRHHGHLLILLVCCMWLSPYSRFMRVNLIPRFVGSIDKFKKNFFTAILFANLIAGSIAVIFDWAYPFSGSKAVARFIQKHQMGEMFLVGDDDFAASAVSALLGKVFYYPRGDRTGTFIIWDEKRNAKSRSNVFHESLDFGRQYNKVVLFILNYEVDSPGYTISSVADFTGCIVKDEEYYLYVVEGEDNIDWMENLKPRVIRSN